MQNVKLKNPYVRFAKGLVITAAVLLAAVAVLTYVIDPFYHYHAPWFGLSAVQTKKEYQVPGALEHLSYNAVICGSSLVENNDNAWYDQAFGVQSVKAVRSYGGVADLCWYLDLAFESHDVDMVFFNLDAFAITGSPKTTFEASGCPMYLYDDNALNDMQYLWNKTVLLEDIPYMVIQSKQGYDAGLSYNWAEGKNFSQAGALSQYQRRKDVAPMEDESAEDADVSGNIALLLKEVEQHPDTQFLFFLPPYSMLWWDDSQRAGLSEVYLHAEEEVMTSLLSHDNVRVYDYQTMTDVTCTLDRYMDTIHFDPEVNHTLCEDMAADYRGDGTSLYRVTAENLSAVMEKTRQCVEKGMETVIVPLEKSDAFLYAE